MANVQLKNIVKIYPYVDKKPKKSWFKKTVEEPVKKTNLQITDKGVVAVQQFNLDIKDGEFIVLVGPSGCGKSTILNIISSLEKESNGKVNINAEIGYMFQKDNLLPYLNIYKNIILGLEIQKKKTKENLDYALSLINKYGLADFINYYPNELSG